MRTITLRERLRCFLFGHDLYMDAIPSATVKWVLTVENKEYPQATNYKLRGCCRCRGVVLDDSSHLK